MKKIIIIIALILPLIYYGCKSDNVIGPTTNNIDFTFTKGDFSGQPAVFFQPSENVTIKTFSLKQADSLHIDTTFNSSIPSYLYDKDTAYVIISGNSLVVSGYKWNFGFSGNKASNDEIFNFTKDYTIP
jgi:hypothetical protein